MTIGRPGNWHPELLKLPLRGDHTPDSRWLIVIWVLTWVLPAWLPEAIGSGEGYEGRAGGALLRERRFLEGRWWESWVGWKEGAWYATPKLISVSFPTSHKIPHSGTKVWDGSGRGRPPNPIPAREARPSVDSSQSWLKCVGLSEFPGTWSSVKATPHPRAAEHTVHGLKKMLPPHP